MYSVKTVKYSKIHLKIEFENSLKFSSRGSNCRFSIEIGYFWSKIDKLTVEMRILGSFRTQFLTHYRNSGISKWTFGRFLQKWPFYFRWWVTERLCSRIYLWRISRFFSDIKNTWNHTFKYKQVILTLFMVFTGFIPIIFPKKFFWGWFKIG